MRRPPSLIYAADERPPLLHLILLGLQYACMMFPYLIIVVILDQTQGKTGSNPISLCLIALSIGTVLQIFKKGPLGSGFLAPPVISAIYFPSSLAAAKLGGLGLVYGMTLLAGIIECGFSFFLHRLKKIFSPVVSGLIITAVGLQLGLLALSQVFMIKDYANPLYGKHLVAGSFTLLVMISLTIWAKGMLRLLAPFIGITLGFFLSLALKIIPPLSLEHLSHASWLAFPKWVPIDYTFSLSLLIPFFLAALAAAIRTIGVITTCQKINDLDWSQPHLPSLKKGVLADGVGCALGGLLGVPGINSAPSLVGISQATGATSRVIAFSLATWLVVLAFLPKFTYLFLAIPLSVMGAALLYTASFMITGGIELITARKLSTRSILIIGISLLLGISHSVFPDFYKELPKWIHLFTDSLLSIVTLSAVLLNLLFLIKSKESLISQKHIESEDSIGHLLNESKIPPPLIKRAQTSSLALIQLLKNGYIREGLIIFDVVQDAHEVLIKFSYQGTLPPLKFNSEKERQLIEESAFTLGLSTFLSEIWADHIKVSCKEEKCQVELIFEN